jgi:LmbE family N-acetylglucosaminyl deacetylase
VAVATVFAGDPEPRHGLSLFARELHERWGHPVEAVGVRREEDGDALSVLGAEALHWPYMDCIYRKTASGDFPYDSEQALWGRIHPEEAGLVQALRERIRAVPLLPEGALFVPLAVGGHVDHRIVRCAAEGIERRWRGFEDFPYAEDEGALEAALAGGTWEEELVPLSAEALQAKTIAVASYSSQISSFWGSAADMEAALRDFAEHTGAGGPAERYWTPMP